MDLMRKMHKTFSDAEYENMFKDKLIKNSTSRAKALGKRKSTEKCRSGRKHIIEDDEDKSESINAKYAPEAGTFSESSSYQENETLGEKTKILTEASDQENKDVEKSAGNVDNQFAEPQTKRRKVKRKVTKHTDLMGMKDDFIINEDENEESELDLSEVSDE